MINCPECKGKVKLTGYNDVVIVEGKRVQYWGASYFCAECNEYYDTKETLGKNLKSARKAANEKNKQNRNCQI